MDKIEIGPDVFLDLEGSINEFLLPLLTNLIWFVIIFIILLKSYQGINRKIKGSRYIFWGMMGSFLFFLASSLFLFLIENTVYDYPVIPFILEFLSSSILLFSCWGFKVLLDNFKMYQVEANT